MILLTWIVTGLIVGLLTGGLLHHGRNALGLDMILGIAGACGGGLAIRSLGFPAGAALAAGLVGAAAGAVGMLAGYRAIFRPAQS